MYFKMLKNIIPKISRDDITNNTMQKMAIEFIIKEGIRL
jgi:hypothetical protein